MSPRSRVLNWLVGVVALLLLAPISVRAQTCTVDANCNDNNTCTTDTCPAGTCVFTNVADGTVCDDNNVCTTGDSCQAGVCTGGAFAP
ncbi:MAG: hypothetical protein AAB363_06670, partial [Planctomycetota bacterium]